MTRSSKTIAASLGLTLSLSFSLSLAACARATGDTIEATGTLEVVEVDVAPTMPARVARVLVDEGALVKAGDTLAVLSIATLPADIAQREARAAAAGATLAELEHGARAPELRRAEAELAGAEADASRAAKDAERLRPLAASQMVSAQSYDAAWALAQTTAARRDAQRQSLDLLREGTRAERVRAARADAAGAQASVEGARATARDLVLVAPVDGTVTSRAAQPGEVIGTGQPALTISETNRQTVRVFVGQGALSRLKIGQAVRAVLDAYPDRVFTGKIVAISPKAEFTPRVALTEKERADLLFAVKAEFADASGMLKAGIPVTVRIDAPVPPKAAP
jgi:HlyD family secretion protein